MIKLETFWYKGIRFSRVEIDPVTGDVAVEGGGVNFRLNPKGIAGVLRQARRARRLEIERQQHDVRIRSVYSHAE